MTPESIVTSIEWSKKLKELGWDQEEALYEWTQAYDWESGRKFRTTLLQRAEKRRGEKHGRWKVGGGIERKFFATPTTEEILRRLPKVIDQELCLQINVHGDRWNVGYWNVNEQTMIKYQQFQDTLANAAAAMYCYLSSHNLLPS